MLAPNGHIHIYSESPMSTSVGELLQSLTGEEADTEAHHREFGNDITNTQGWRWKRNFLPIVVLQNGEGYSNGHGDMPPGLENMAKALFQGDSPSHCKPSALGKERPRFCYERLLLLLLLLKSIICKKASITPRSSYGAPN